MSLQWIEVFFITIFMDNCLSVSISYSHNVHFKNYVFRLIHIDIQIDKCVCETCSILNVKLFNNNFQGILYQ